jgi:hypothetical protein
MLTIPSMSRDYMEIVAGKRAARGQIMPKWERQMRAAVREAIEHREKQNLELEEAKKAAAETDD